MDLLEGGEKEREVWCRAAAAVSRHRHEQSMSRSTPSPTAQEGAQGQGDRRRSNEGESMASQNLINNNNPPSQQQGLSFNSMVVACRDSWLPILILDQRFAFALSSLFESSSFSVPILSSRDH